MENTSAEKFFNIKKIIFQEKSVNNDRIVPLKESGNDSYSDSKRRKKADKLISDNYQFVGSYCQLCDFRPRIRAPAVLEAHMITHTGDKPFTCAVCDFSTAYKHYLETHMRKHTGEKPFHCPQCQFSTSRNQNLTDHLLTHTGEKPFACTECDFKCARKKGLIQHWSFHCKFEHFRCSVCDYKCRKSNDLKNHVLTHPAIIPCPKCDYMGRCKEDLEKHNLTHVKKETRRYTCSKCGRSFTEKRKLQYHILRNCKKRVIQ